MGQAKLRGTFEQRQAEAKAKAQARAVEREKQQHPQARRVSVSSGARGFAGGSGLLAAVMLASLSHHPRWRR